MPNPLRVPIVLMVILGAMLAYVHASHRERNAAEVTDLANVDELSLRKFGAPPRTAALRNGASADIGPTRPVSQASVADLLSAAIGPMPLQEDRTSTPPVDEAMLPKPLTAERHQVTKLPSIGRSEPEVGQFVPRTDTSGQRDTRPATQRHSQEPSHHEEPMLRRLRGPHVDDASSRPQHVPTDRRAAPRRAHRISDGDTLRQLAGRYLGSEERDREIFEANRDILVRPDLLPIGHILRIPESGSR